MCGGQINRHYELRRELREWVSTLCPPRENQQETPSLVKRLSQTEMSVAQLQQVQRHVDLPQGQR